MKMNTYQRTTCPDFIFNGVGGGGGGVKEEELLLGDENDHLSTDYLPSCCCFFNVHLSTDYLPCCRHEGGGLLAV